MKTKFRTLDLAVEQYHKIKALKLKGEVRSQIERAAMSVVLNLGEGNAKFKAKDKRRFFNISYASQKEVQLLIMLERRPELIQLSDSLAAHLYKLQHARLVDV